MIYYWRAKNKAGETKLGSLESLSPGVAEQQLKSQGFTSIEVSTDRLNKSPSSAASHGSDVSGSVFIALAVLSWIAAFAVCAATGFSSAGISTAIIFAANGLILFAVGSVVKLPTEAVALLRIIAERK